MNPVKSLVTNLIFSASVLAAPVPDSWLDAVQQIETGGEKDPDAALGDSKKARGRFQFHKEAWEDTTEIRKCLGLRVYPFTRAHDRDIATEYARTWLTHLRDRVSLAIGRKAFAHETWLAFNLGYHGFKHYGFRPSNPLLDDRKFEKAMKIYRSIYVK
ncbi:hypothetical protein UFOVP549_47 [uncultured Caudovirales phage]|uniref:Uncharacterized protein n=1 Tax=uncultured Caudovirales phage TaxID=2100421 RepID=A0A6J5MVV4_9CAUD|nr:hypothetical protein UFOVP549_47 [uncultured Caudovirales phage]